MPRNIDSDGLIHTSGEWFVATITGVGEREDYACSNWPCSWEAGIYCNNLKAIDLSQEPIVTGSHEESRNVAYPITGNEPSVGQTVLMRFRGTDTEGGQVYEFVDFYPSTPLALTAIQCSGDVLSATYSEGCVNQT